MFKLLIVDDEPNLLYSLKIGLQSDDLEIVTASNGAEGFESVGRERPDAVVLDVRLPDVSGLEVFTRIHQHDPRLPVIIVTAHGTTDTAIEATKRGAFDYLVKPVDLHQLRDVVSKALELRRMQVTPAVIQAEGVDDPSSDQIVGHCPAMQAVYKDVGRTAARNVTVLIRGESGTGKELVARAIYQHSSRASQPFLAINCAAIPESLLESELFGHERGAFTGADRKRIGKFEQAHGGTLFLDEVGDMSPPTQAKLLRLLQEQRFERVGGSETLAVDVRILAATNQDLDALCTSGRFRLDLLYRLNAFTISLPPLRERGDDILLLSRHLLRLASRRMNKPVSSIDESALTLLRNHAWPGNVRELQNAIRYAVVRAVAGVVTADCLPDSVRGDGALPPAAAVAWSAPDLPAVVAELLSAGDTDIYRRTVEVVDRYLIRTILEHTKGNQAAASSLLGLSRTTLRAKLRALGINPDGEG